MCDPFTLAAIGSLVVGTGAQAKGQSDTKKQNAYAMNQQTELSANEFNQRNELAKQIFGENFDISKATYQELGRLSDEEFQTRTGLSKQAFNQLNDIEKQKVIRDAASATSNVDTIRNARIGRQGQEDQARAEYEQTLADANTKQDAYRGQADTVGSDLIAAFTPEAMQDRRAQALSAREALLSSLTPTPAAPQNNPIVARHMAAGAAKSAARNQVAGELASYDQMLYGGNRAIDSGNENTAFITDAARRSLAPLGAQLNVSSTKYNNAGGNYRGAVEAADADLSAALGLSDTRARGDSTAVTGYTGAMDDAYNRFYGNQSGTVGTRGDTLIGANNTRLAGTNSVSQNLENTMQGITNYRMANSSSPWATLGQFASAIGPTLNSVGQRNAFSKPPVAGA